ncbi:F-box/kelch-repeat protein [Cardamine amara subsp. amara]|uniref:F-box/kelch-repeat protein n=1 Tax=Cardamine amara subsp. amara TaxID=228776 RepID=A0ABD0ZWX5_CARAN
MRKSPTKLSPESTPNSSLPDDLVVSCLARVPRLYHPNLSIVSKSFFSILTSPELYRIRTVLGRTETFLYVCLRFPGETNLRWFTLYRKPNHTTKKKTKKKKKNKKKKKTKKKKKDLSCNVLAPVPSLNSPPVELSGFTAVGSNIYSISPTIEDSPSSNVWFLDCRTHTWLEAPRMRLAQSNELMYLAGSSEKPESLNFVEVYNTKTQTWKPVLPKIPIFKPRNLEGKVYTLLNSDVKSRREYLAYKLKDSTCEVVKLDTDSNRESICIIGNIGYVYLLPGVFLWISFGTEGAVWRMLEGLEGLPKFASDSTVKLANYGGKLVVLWDKYVRASGQTEKMISCAEISLEKRNNKKIWGKVEWFDAVLTVPKSYKFMCAITATV